MADESNEKTLDQLRDEKCIPVAHGILNDIAVDLIPADANEKVDYNPILLKILQRNLEADLNITSDIPYVFQLVLGVLSGLNKTVQGVNTVPIDDVRYGAIGKKVLGILATANITIAEKVDPEQVDKEFAPVAEQLSALFAEEKLSMLEVKYIMDNIFESFNTVQNIHMTSIAQSTERAEAKLFGVEFMTDMTLGKLDKVLKEVK